MDNSFFSGRVLEPEKYKLGDAIHKFNLYAKEQDRTDMSMISLADGIALLYVK